MSRMFVMRMANAWYVHIFGWSFTVPAPMLRSYLDSQKWDEGWRAGFEAGLRVAREPQEETTADKKKE